MPKANFARGPRGLCRRRIATPSSCEHDQRERGIKRGALLATKLGGSK
jgi:hypothetical protein